MLPTHQHVPAAGSPGAPRPVRGLPLPAAPPPAAGPGGGGVWSALSVMGALLLLLVALTAVTGVGDVTGGSQLRIAVVILAAGLVTLVVGLIVQGVVRSSRSRLAAAAVALAVVVTLYAGWGGWWFLGDVAALGDGRVPALLATGATGFAVWAFRRMQRNRRLPWWLILLGLGWGATAALPLPLLLGHSINEYLLDTVAPGVTRVILTAGFTTAVVEEVSKGLGVLLAYLVFRRYISTMLAGIVLGATVGLGFNVAESVLFMIGDTGRLLFQFWHRQAAGLPLGHATLTAIIGAGVGLAAQQRRVAAQAACMASGLTLAVADHALWNVAVIEGVGWRSDDPVTNTLLWAPLTLWVFKGPLFVIVLVLVILGRRMETAALVTELRREAVTGLNAVRPEEVALLATPLQRFLVRVQALCDYGFRARQLVAALHQAQLTLALVRWHRARGNVPEPPGAEAALRLHIGMLRRQLFSPGMARPR